VREAGDFVGRDGLKERGVKGEEGPGLDDFM